MEITPGFWGPVTASINWCEHDYEMTHYIAEAYNSITSLGFCLVGLLGLYHARMYSQPRAVRSLWYCSIIVGLGSAAFHGTLLALCQMFDEVPMVWFSLGWIYLNSKVLAKAKDTTTHIPAKAFIAYATFWTLVHPLSSFVIVFQANFIAMLAYASYLVIQVMNVPAIKANTRLNNIMKRGWKYMAAAAIAWMCDQQLCDLLKKFPLGNPQLHGWWHLLMAVLVYHGIMFSIGADAVVSGKNCRIMRYKYLPMDYCHVSDPAEDWPLLLPKTANKMRDARVKQMRKSPPPPSTSANTRVMAG